MKKPLVTLLVPDVGTPTLGAAIRLAGLIEPNFGVEIVGPDQGSGICSLYRNAYPVKSVSCPRLYRYPDFWWERKRIAQAVQGQVVIALKAYMDTVPLALGLRRERKARVIVYLDEWDGAVLQGISTRKRIHRWFQNGHHPLDDIYYARVERLIPRADMVWSSTTFLQRKFGGHVVPMGVDVDRYQPQSATAVAQLRHRLGLEGCRVLVFGGVVRPHKGVELLLEAMECLNDPTLRLLVAGPVTEHLMLLQQNPRWSRWLAVAGAAPPDPAGINADVHRHMPLYLDLADLIVLPLNDTPLAQSQMPIKLFEAMAMGKPIIGSAVADLPLMLEGCGWIVPPNQPRPLADTMARVLGNPAEARAYGERARQRCVARFSQSVIARQIDQLLNTVLK